MKQPISAKQLKQQLSVAPLNARLEIKKRLFEMAETDPDACIEAMHLMGEYTDEQVDDYYHIKRMCEENDAEEE